MEEKYIPVYTVLKLVLHRSNMALKWLMHWRAFLNKFSCPGLHLCDWTFQRLHIVLQDHAEELLVINFTPKSLLRWVLILCNKSEVTFNGCCDSLIRKPIWKWGGGLGLILAPEAGLLARVPVVFLSPSSQCWHSTLKQATTTTFLIHHSLSSCHVLLLYKK